MHIKKKMKKGKGKSSPAPLAQCALKMWVKSFLRIKNVSNFVVHQKSKTKTKGGNTKKEDKAKATATKIFNKFYK